MRFEFRNRDVLRRIREQYGQYILVFWHSRLALMPFGYPGDRIAVLASTHRDSELLGLVLKRFGVARARGSSTRGGVAGLRELLRRVRDGYDLGITPDGPRGPRRRVKAGVIATAAFTGKPIVPVAVAASRGLRIPTWDRTLVPFPFSRGAFLYGEPLIVPRGLTGEQSEALRVSLEHALDSLTDEADRAVGFSIEEPRVEDPPP
jgi:lysophospholipid acyltransferase (LPLAT)-like uncharacterized protein